MTDRTRSDPSVREAPAADFQAWEAPGRNFKIYLNTGVIERLRADSCHALTSVSTRGVEIGGILLGRTELNGGRILLIENLITIPCEYRNGPYYSLSVNDAIWFQAVLLKYRAQAGSAMTVVGYYRSHIRDSLFLHAEDLMLIRTHFPDPANIFLAIKPAATGTCTLGFFFWEGGVVHSDPRYLEIQSPVAGSPASAVPQPTASPATAGEAVAATPAEAPGARIARRLRPRTAAIAAVAIAISCTAYVLVSKQHSQPKLPLAPKMEAEAPASSPLELQVEARSGSLLLTWNRGASQVKTARMALLSIRDSNSQRVVDLDMNQLRTGSIFYTPASGDVEFRLEIYGDDNSHSGETVRVLSPRPDSPSRRQSPAHAVMTPTDAVMPPSGRAGPPAQQIPPEASLATSFQRVDVPVAPRSFSPPDPLRSPEPKLIAGEPPPLEAAAPAHIAAVNPVLAVAAPSAAPAPRPAPPSPPVSTYVPPVAIQQVAPSLPSNIKALVVEDISVQVIVNIDATGKVVKATTVGNSNALAAYLGQSAIAAAKAWRFRPARNGGKNIPSEMVLSFRFTRQRS